MIDRDGAAGAAAPVDRAHQDAAELALRHRAELVQRLGRDRVRPLVLLDAQVPDLRAVAVDDDDLPPTGLQGGNLLGGLDGVGLDLVRPAVLVGRA